MGFWIQFNCFNPADKTSIDGIDGTERIYRVSPAGMLSTGCAVCLQQMNWFHIYQIRLTDGSALRSTFKPTDTVQTVVDYVATNRTDSVGAFALTTYPGRKDFGPADALMTLKDAGKFVTFILIINVFQNWCLLGLVPSSVLIVKKI